jgi:4a-hydroxytetrahydrobiopterin dehydratase
VSRTVELTSLILAVTGKDQGMATLTLKQVATELAATPGWLYTDGRLTRTVTRKDFRDALLFVNAVGYLAERSGHHPDVLIEWNTVTLTMVTHSAGGLTDKDFALAREVSGLC